MAIFHLVRHGHHDWLQRGFPGRSPGVSLSELGVVDAVRVGEWLSHLPISAVISSPLERAQQTAAQLARRLNLEVQTEPDFNEFDFGSWSGLSFPELHAQPGWVTWQSARSLCRPPDGETIIEVQARVVGLLSRLAQTHGDQHIAMFGHGDPIKTALAYGLGSPLDNVTRIDVEPASVSSMEITAKGTRVLRVNRLV
jgi:broad specificity phosphatase PhoE